MIDDRVRISSCRVVAYDLPLNQPWTTSHGKLTHRRGWLISLMADGGIAGCGECAPLEQAGTEPHDEAGESLHRWADRVAGMRLSRLWQLLDEETTGPAVRCALEGAVVDLAARRRRRPLAHLLNPAAPLEVAVNAAVGSADKGLVGRAARAVSDGFKVLKVKVGAGPAEIEIGSLRSCAERLPPGVTLRLDANGAWNLAAARVWMRELEGLPIEAVEEPLADMDPDDLRGMQREVNWSLAADESLVPLIGISGPGGLPVRRIVIKPMVVGGVRPSLRLATQASDCEVVVTTTLEAAPGRWLTAHLAAALDDGFAHGLDTGRWLSADVGPGPVIRRGRCRLEDPDRLPSS